MKVGRGRLVKSMVCEAPDRTCTRIPVHPTIPTPGKWVDREVMEDGTWVTSRQPDDIPAFNEAMIKLFSRMAR